MLLMCFVTQVTKPQDVIACALVGSHTVNVFWIAPIFIALTL